MKTSLLGRYREIVIAVALFLVLDLGVLVLNFYTSFKISEDAAAINVAGRQRMLSQRMAKLAYALESPQADASAGVPKVLADELKASVDLFDLSLRAFRDGGSTRGGDGKPVELNQVTSANGITALTEAESFWKPMKERALAALNPQATPEDFKSFAEAARAANLKLLARMNDLTTSLEADAAARANFLRLVQAVAIFLALLNFAYILFKFIRRLRATDEQVAAVSQERQQILSSVREGLFLIDPSGAVGTQISRSVGVLLGVEAKPGQSFFELMAPMITPAALQDARDYVEMLLQPRVKEQLVQGINPLSSLTVNTLNTLGQPVERHLSFAFTRVMDEGAVKHLLATVQDISTQVDLQKSLQGERQRAQHEFSLLLEAVKTDHNQLRDFSARAQTHLEEANALLKRMGETTNKGNWRDLLRQAQRCTHAIKGDAGSIGLELVANLAHRFEMQLRKVQDAGLDASRSSAEAVVALPLALEDLQNKLRVIRDLADSGQSGATPSAEHTTSSSNVYDQLAQQIARDLNKEVAVTVDMPAWANLTPVQQNAIHEITVQLVRNAVAHGVDEPAARHAALKPASGRIDVVLFESQQQATLVVRDDGTGLVQAKLRKRLTELCWFTEAQLQAMSDNHVLAQMFKPGFSTAAPEGLHAGQGVGLDLVNAKAQSLSGKIGIGTQAGRFTEFRVSFPLLNPQGDAG